MVGFSTLRQRLGEEIADLSVFRTFVRFALVVLSVSSSSWCLGRAAVCDCGTPGAVCDCGTPGAVCDCGTPGAVCDCGTPGAVCDCGTPGAVCDCGTPGAVCDCGTPGAVCDCGTPGLFSSLFFCSLCGLVAARCTVFFFHIYFVFLLLLCKVDPV